MIRPPVGRVIALAVVGVRHERRGIAGAVCYGGVDHGFSELAPGAVLRYAATWTGVTVLGAPAEPGEYVIHAAFPLLREDVPVVPAAYRAERDSRPLWVELPLRAAGPGGGNRGLPARVAFERMLSHPQLVWLVAEPDALASARLCYRDGVWELRAPRSGGRVLVARIADEAFAGPTVALETARLP